MKRIIRQYIKGTTDEIMMVFDWDCILTVISINIKVKSDNEVNNLINIFKESSVIPSFCFINSKSQVMRVQWFATDTLLIFNKSQYENLLEELINYLLELGVSEWEIDPQSMDGGYSIDKEDLRDLSVVINPEFNNKNFGVSNSSYMQIYNVEN